jgi:L-alanine-DL-glutamate epimerase-like enolase superfamily enzyme
VTLEQNGVRGRGESVGSYYLGETAESMATELQAVADAIGDNLTSEDIQRLLPACGARNALDCALWDYRARASRQSIWQLLGLEPRELTTVFTLGIAEPAVMAEWATAAKDFPHLKIKLDADRPVERLEAIRGARPDATLVIDVNQGWDFDELQEYLQGSNV